MSITAPPSRDANAGPECPRRAVRALLDGETLLDPRQTRALALAARSRGSGPEVEVRLPGRERPIPAPAGGRRAGGRGRWVRGGVLIAVAAGCLAGAGVSSPAVATPAPAPGAWSPAGRLSVARPEGSVTALADGRVLAVGGGLPQVASVDVFDPATGAWSPAGAMASARGAHAAVRLGDGRVLVSGGRTESQALTGAEVFDPVTATWSPTGAMAVSRQAHTATLLSGGKVLVAGGLGGGHGPYRAETELYDPATGTWTPTAPLPQGRAHHSATALADGRVLVVGGEGAPHDASLRDAAVYDPVKGTWEPVPNLLATGRADHSATALADGSVLVAGGTRLHIGGRPDNMVRSAEVLDRSGSTWLAGPDMSQRRSYHASTVLGDGRVLVTGGFGDRIATPTATAELYDPVPRRWAPAAPMPGPAAGHGAVLLEGTACAEACGAVLVVGELDTYLYRPQPAARSSAESDRTALKVIVAVAGGVVPLVLVGIVLLRLRRHPDGRTPGRGRSSPNQTMERR